MIIASVGKAGEVHPEQLVCGICEFALTELGECPRCKLQNEETARDLRASREREKLFRQVDEVVEEAWGEPGTPTET